MNKMEIIDVLSKEIDWCEKNPIPYFSDEYRNGFRNGLLQARFMVSQIGLVAPLVQNNNSPCGHPVTSLVKLGDTVICRECQDAITQNLILTLDAQTKVMETE